MYLADTSALIALRKGSETGKKVEKATGNAQLAVASISVFELLDGASDSEVKQTEQLLMQSDLLAFDDETARISADLSKQLKISGKTVPQLDLFIASIALKYRLPLVTLDGDFERIPNLKVTVVKP